MIEHLIAACARHRILTVVGVLIAVGFGIAALSRTSLDAVPDQHPTLPLALSHQPWHPRHPRGFRPCQDLGGDFTFQLS